MIASVRAVVNVATGAYIKGQERLTNRLAELGEGHWTWSGELPPDSPAHSEIPYAFKAYALKAAARSATSLLWADACIYPVKPLDELWERIERDGYWIGNGGWSNLEWTADEAYPDLFPDDKLFAARAINSQIPHVVAGAFGLSLSHPTGRAIFDEYYRLAKTKAFCGPWTNGNNYQGTSGPGANPRCYPCGPFPDVRGHRHDQTALSVIAWRLGCKLTNSPAIFAYGKVGDVLDPATVLLADG